MKRLLISASLMMVSVVVALAQGTVNFDNRSIVLSSPPDRLVRYDSSVTSDPTLNAQYNPFSSNSAPVVNFNAVYLAQLYYGASTVTESSLVPVMAFGTNHTANFRSETTPSPGTWIQGARTLDGFIVGQTVNLQVRVWDSAFGSTWETASGGLSGVSAVFLYTIPSPVDIQGLNMNNFQGFTLSPVPEPATVALAGLGAAALLIFRRRK